MIVVQIDSYMYTIFLVFINTFYISFNCTTKFIIEKIASFICITEEELRGVGCER